MRIGAEIGNVFRNKARAALTVTGIAVGVFSVVLISAIGQTGAAAVSSSLDNMGINSIMVEAGDSSAELDEACIPALSSLSGVSQAMPLMYESTQYKLLSENNQCWVWGVDVNAKDIINLTASYGRLINEYDTASHAAVCVIDEAVALDTYGRTNIVGKKLKLLLGGVYRELEIVGIADSGLNVLRTALSGAIPDFVYVPYSTMQLAVGRTSPDKIAVLAENNSDNESLIGRIKAQFTVGESQAVNVSNLLGQKTQLEDILNVVTLILSLIAGISLFVSGINVMTSMLVSVSERRYEIGIKKAVGAKNIRIMTEFLLESFIICGIGGIIGAVGGISIAAGGAVLLGFTPIIDFVSVGGAVAISLVTGLAFGVYPARQAARMKPIDALRQ